MSLINDALRRANEARGSQPPGTPTPAAMRPVPGSPAPMLWPFLLIPVVSTLIMMAALWFLWRGWQLSRQARATAPAPMVQAREPLGEGMPPGAPGARDSQADSIEPRASSPAPNPSGFVRSATLAVAPPPVSPPPGPMLRSGDAGPHLAFPAPNMPNAGAPGASASAPAAAPPDAPRPRFKLQAIFYRPGKSSVMVNSQMLGVGDAVEDARVLAISRNSVTLEQGGETNVLTLR